jgi:hypothetical protein
MKIREYYYDEYNRTLNVEFSTKEDKDDYYRILDLSYEDIEFFCPDIIDDNDLKTINKYFIIEVISQYLLENDLPESQTL